MHSCPCSDAAPDGTIPKFSADDTAFPRNDWKSSPRLSGVSFLGAILLCISAGCGGGSTSGPQPPATTSASEVKSEEDANPAEAKAADLAKGKKWKIGKPDEKASPPAPPLKNDISKWAIADIDAALARNNLMFVPGLMVYSARRPDDSKRAAELEGLLRRVAKMKDDPNPSLALALPPGAFPAEGSGAAAPAAKAADPMMQRFSKFGKMMGH